MQICILPIGIMFSDKSKEIQLEEKTIEIAFASQSKADVLRWTKMHQGALLSV